MSSYAINLMIRAFITVIAISIATNTMAQDRSFKTAINNLFFGIQIHGTTSSLIDSLRMNPKLSYKEPSIKQRNLNTSIEFGSDAWSSRHIFTFSESPLPQLKIKSGQIYLTLVETPSAEKIVGKLWIVEFDDKAAADSFFNYLKSIFDLLSTQKSVRIDDEGYHIAEYSTRNSSETEIRDIRFVLGKQHQKPGYEILLTFWNELNE